jgi:hypothetical protein
MLLHTTGILSDRGYVLRFRNAHICVQAPPTSRHRFAVAVYFSGVVFCSELPSVIITAKERLLDIYKKERN